MAIYDSLVLDWFDIGNGFTVHLCDGGHFNDPADEGKVVFLLHTEETELLIPRAAAESLWIGWHRGNTENLHEEFDKMESSALDSIT
tara:strand:- start:530 stop:790 length:261 start_codon:yes stop_codon:yes gene_type:complete